MEISLPPDHAESIVAGIAYWEKFGIRPPRGLSRRYANNPKEYTRIMREAIEQNRPFPEDDPEALY